MRTQLVEQDSSEADVPELPRIQLSIVKQVSILLISTTNALANYTIVLFNVQRAARGEVQRGAPYYKPDYWP